MSLDWVRQAFGAQTMFTTLGAEMTALQPGFVELRLDRWEHLRQQHGYLHGGATATLADSACGLAAMAASKTPCNALTVEFKINFLSPAAGVSFLARGRVKKAGRTITVSEGEVIAVNQHGESKTVAVMLATIMMMPPTPQ